MVTATPPRLTIDRFGDVSSNTGPRLLGDDGSSLHLVGQTRGPA